MKSEIQCHISKRKGISIYYEFTNIQNFCSKKNYVFDIHEIFSIKIDYWNFIIIIFNIFQT